MVKRLFEPLNYMERISKYYTGLGYGEPYRWARQREIPFAKLKKPLKNSTVGIVTTAALFNPKNGDQGPGAAYNGKAKFFNVYREPISPFPELRISHIAIDRTHTTASDIHTYFPLKALSRLQESGFLGRLAPNFYGLPTNRSQKITIEKDSVELVRLFKRDKVDAAIFVPNCPICHQSVALAASSLERTGTPTVIMGCALDIVEYVGAPRFVFNDFPLGNSAGLPDNVSSQDLITKMSLDLLIEATRPRTTKKSPFDWSGTIDWKKDYSNINLLTNQEIKDRRKEFDEVKKEVKSIKGQ